jgi:hypothetical protein
MSYEEDFEVKLHFPAVCIEIKLDFVRNYQFQRCAASAYPCGVEPKNPTEGPFLPVATYSK